jgi:hypothetical protein
MTPIRPRRRSLFVLAAATAAVSVAATAFATTRSPWTQTVAPHTYTGTHVTLTDNLSTWSERIGDAPGRTHTPFDQLRFTCHGGRATVIWYIGNLEPEEPQTGIHLDAYFDNRKIATLIRGSHDGIWDDSPASIITVVACPKGVHVLSARMDFGGSWNVPYANSNDRVQRGFVVQEVWR